MNPYCKALRRWLPEKRSFRSAILFARCDLALANDTFPYLLKLANLGANAAIRQNACIAQGVHTFQSTPTAKPVADLRQRCWQAVAELVESEWE